MDAMTTIILLIATTVFTAETPAELPDSVDYHQAVAHLDAAQKAASPSERDSHLEAADNALTTAITGNLSPAFARQARLQLVDLLRQRSRLQLAKTAVQRVQVVLCRAALIGQLLQARIAQLLDVVQRLIRGEQKRVVLQLLGFALGIARIVDYLFGRSLRWQATHFHALIIEHGAFAFGKFRFP